MVIRRIVGATLAVALEEELMVIALAPRAYGDCPGHLHLATAV